MNNKTLNEIEQFVTQYCWENLPGDDTWSNNFHSCALGGAEIAEKDLEQKIKDLYNKYCSQLKEEQQPKLTKTINKERVLILSSKIQVLGELKNKLEK